MPREPVDGERFVQVRERPRARLGEALTVRGGHTVRHELRLPPTAVGRGDESPGGMISCGETEIGAQDVQAEVYPGGGPGRGEHAALVDEEHALVELDFGKLLREHPGVVPVRRRALPVEQAGRGEREGSGRDGRDPRPSCVRFAERDQQLFGCSVRIGMQITGEEDEFSITQSFEPLFDVVGKPVGPRDESGSHPADLHGVGHALPGSEDLGGDSDVEGFRPFEHYDRHAPHPAHTTAERGKVRAQQSWRSKVERVSIRHAYASTILGDMLLVAEGDALAGAYFDGHTYPPQADAIGELIELADSGQDGAPEGHNEDRLLTQAARELREYLAGERQEFDVPLVTHGDEFSERVWRILLDLPYGGTTTYGAIAREMGNLSLAQRVGQAVGHNPISIIVPCHRVLGADGSLTGYAGGLERKRALLALEEPSADEAGRLF